MKSFFVAAFFLLIGFTSMAQEAPVSTESLMKEAYNKATKENKKVLLIFHASWCSWCRKMETSINDPNCNKLFNDNYVIVYLDVLEHGDKKGLENPGANEFLGKFEDKASSLPYFLMLDAKGNVLTDSNVRVDGKLASATEDNNLGCPATEKEVDYFVQMLRSTSKLDENELAAIKTRFRKNETVKTPGTN